MQKYTGAGIFIIENYKGNLVAVLFGNKGRNYDDPGGLIDPGETPIETACRETREETANLIKISPDELHKISHKIIYKNYVSYVIFVENLSSKDYYHNINLVFGKCKPHFWKENSSMIRIDLQRLIKNTLANNDIVKDINGNYVKIRGRTLGIVKNAFPFLANLKCPTRLKRNKTIKSRMACLIGTYTYTVQ